MDSNYSALYSKKKSLPAYELHLSNTIFKLEYQKYISVQYQNYSLGCRCEMDM